MADFANGGKIVVELELENGKYKLGVRDSVNSTTALTGALDKGAASAKNMERAHSALGNRFQSVLMTMASLRFAIMDINDVFLRLPASIIKSAGELERMQALMTGLSKESDKTKAKMEGMSDFNFVIGVAKNAPFEISAISDSFVKLKTAGIDPTNGSMQTLIDSVARFGGTSETLKRATIAIQQMQGKGVVSMEELRQQLGEAVPTAMQAMADSLGVTMEKLADVVKTGKLSAGPAIQAMLLKLKQDNEGAAQEMMNTWVGVSSRLKTEWDLTAKHIADQGFMNSVKESARGLTEFMQNAEVRQFGVEFGESLREIVTAGVELTKFLIKYREEVKMLAAAWVAYKTINIVTGTIQPIANALKTKSMEAIAAAQNERASSRILTEGLREDYRNQAVAAIEAGAKRANLATQEIARLRAESMAIRAELDARIVDINRYNAALASASGTRAVQVKKPDGSGTDFGGRRISQTDVKAGLDAATESAQRLSNALETNKLAILAQQTAAAQSHVEMNRVVDAANRGAASLDKVTFASRALSVAATAANAAMSAGKWAMAALGGPIGILITGLTLLAGAYYKAKAAADALAIARRNADMGQANAADLANIQGRQADAVKERTKAEKELNESLAERNRYAENLKKNGRSADDSLALKNLDSVVQARRVALERSSKDLNDLTRQLTNASQTVTTAAVEASVSAVNQSITRGEGEINFSVRKVVDKINEEFKESSKKLKGDELAKATQQNIQRIARAQAEGARASLKYNEDMAKSYRETAKTLNGTAAEVYTKAALDAEDRAKNQKKVLETLANPAQVTLPTGGGKDKGGGGKVEKDSPLEKELERIRTAKAQLQAEIDSFDPLTAKFDKVKAALAKVNQKIENGDYDETVGKKKVRPSEDKLKELRDATVAYALADKQQEERRELAEKANSFTEYVKSFQTEYEDAIALIADPFEYTGMGAKQKQMLRDFSKGRLDGLEGYAQRVGKTAEEIKENLVGQAQAIDMKDLLVKTQEETRQINESMVEDSRLAAVARAKADYERHVQVMQNIITEADAMNVNGRLSDLELEKIKKITFESTLAKGKQLEIKSRSPLEQLGQQWANITKNMEDASVSWANKTMDAITEFVTTGKADFKGLVVSILSDLAKLKMQEGIAGLFGKTDKSNGQSGTSGGGFINGIVSIIRGIFEFANGGIMTDIGAVPLRKYANGGIATSPQLALYGEGKRPEAYVPLPDGRTIPVTMSGDGGARGGNNNVTISIVVQKDGSESSSATGANADAFKGMAERVKGVVREELASQARPGGMLYR